MKRSFTIPCKPFSINSMYTTRNVKTVAARNWTLDIILALRVEQDKLSDLRNHFEPMKHYYSVDFVFFYPSEKLYTKKGDLSSKAFDITNCEKGLLDIICAGKYFGTDWNQV